MKTGLDRKMISNRTRLIPRYNWDYGLFDLLNAGHAAISGKSNGTRGFEQIFSQKPILTSSGRSSLYSILRSLDLAPGARVGVPLFCCSIVFDVICEAGLQPLFIDINLNDYNLSVADLEKKKDSLSALIVVHMFGNPADMDEILSVCTDIPVIEDCAHSLFSTYKGKLTGRLSTASFFSFRSGKYISAGEGGAVFCNDTSIRNAITALVDTFERRNLHQEILHTAATYVKSTLYRRPLYGSLGYPLGKRLDQKYNLTAKAGFKKEQVARSDLEIITRRLDSFLNKVNKQRRNAQYLLEELRLEDAYLTRQKGDRESNYYQFPIRFKSHEQRNNMADFLFANGIDSAKYLDDIIEVTKNTYQYQGDCPNAELCSKTVLIVPHYYSLSDRDLEHVAACLNRGQD